MAEVVNTMRPRAEKNNLLAHYVITGLSAWEALFLLERQLHMSTQYFSVGRLVATHGLKGELLLKHSLGDARGLQDLTVIFLPDRPESFLPYFVAQIRIKGPQEAFLTLEGVSTREQAKLLTHKEVWLQESDFSRTAGKATPISYLGYHLIDGAEDLGEIVEVIEQPMQVLCKVIIREKEVLIPLHEKTLEKIDDGGKRLYVTLPEGLLDVYLGL